MKKIEPRAPAVALRLEAAREVARTLEMDVGRFVLDAGEGVPGAAKRLADLRTTIAAADRDVSELTRAHDLALRLDREAVASASADMRAEQLTQFKSQMAAREKAMGAVLTAASSMAAAYGEYSEATLAAATSVPSGTVVPPMSIGDLGFAGPAFGPCERLILAELFRFAPDRKDGAGRFILPFATPAGVNQLLDPAKIQPGIEALVQGDRAIVAEIERQIEHRNSTEQAAARRAAA